ncbi:MULTISPECIES: tetratricopeptide repeat protein [Bacillota]|uniref:tetratricopeptide repeat protein n=1 Tax=Bacillota TaxID=1239 RepID=UPI00257029EA|nr:MULTISPECIES: tetratricopeptide repeat protein [Bacillota]
MWKKIVNLLKKIFLNQYNNEKSQDEFETYISNTNNSNNNKSQKDIYKNDTSKVIPLDDCKTFNEYSSIKIDNKQDNLNINTNIKKSIIESTKCYEVIDDFLVNKQILKDSSYNTFYFSAKVPENYELFKETRVVGCYYRQESIDEVIDTFNKIDEFKFECILEDELENSYDSNAKAVYLIYSINKEIRKVKLGFINKDLSYELRNFTDIKLSLLKIQNTNYLGTKIAIYIKTQEINEIKIRESNIKTANELNKLASTFEESGDIDKAIEKYKESIELAFTSFGAFDRLNILYRKNKNYEAEIENCKKAIDIIKRNNLDDSKIEFYNNRLKRATELNQKQKYTEAKKIERDIKKSNKSQAQQKTKLLKDNVANNVIETVRTCTICNQIKDIEEFEKNGKKSDGSIKYKHQCKACRNKRKREIKKEKQ